MITLCVQSAMMRFGFYVGQSKGMQISEDPAVNKMNEFVRQRGVAASAVGSIYNSDFSVGLDAMLDIKDPLLF